MHNPLLDVRNLRVEYVTPRGSAKAVNNVSFSIAPGEVFGLAGESGCGKSTIAQAILRVLSPPALITGGQMSFDGANILQMDDRALEDFRWRKVSMVFQSAMNALNPVTMVGDQIADVIIRHEKVNRREARERSAEMLKVVGIEPDRLKSYPHELSGGMRQRVVIAIAMALHPALMIMDEPTTALDVVVQKDILRQIYEIKEKMGFSILFITHDVSLMVEISDRMGIMYAGEIVEMAPAKEIFRNPIHPYTQGLLGSFPALTGVKRKLSGIPGAPPNLIDPPPGCKFRPRCAMCAELGSPVEPVLQEVLPGHWVAVHEGMPLPGDTAV